MVHMKPENNSTTTRALIKIFIGMILLFLVLVGYLFYV